MYVRSRRVKLSTCHSTGHNSDFRFLLWVLSPLMPATNRSSVPFFETIPFYNSTGIVCTSGARTMRWFWWRRSPTSHKRELITGEGSRVRVIFSMWTVQPAVTTPDKRRRLPVATTLSPCRQRVSVDRTRKHKASKISHKNRVKAASQSTVEWTQRPAWWWTQAVCLSSVFWPVIQRVTDDDR